MLGLPLSTAVTVILLVVLLMVWRRSRRGHPSLRLDRLTCVSRNRTFLSRLVARVDVRFWHFSDIGRIPIHVCCRVKSGH
jgi:hypothetical protein